jgi:hypothetical protein
MKCPVASVTSCFDVPADSLSLLMREVPRISNGSTRFSRNPAIASHVRVTDLAHDFSSPCPAFVKAAGSSAVLADLISSSPPSGAPEVGIAGGRVRRKSRRAAQSIMFSSRQSIRRLRNDKFDLRNRERFRTQAPCLTPSRRAMGKFSRRGADRQNTPAPDNRFRLRVPRTTRVSDRESNTQIMIELSRLRKGRAGAMRTALRRSRAARSMCTLSHSRPIHEIASNRP